jgi:hypothetical protein
VLASTIAGCQQVARRESLVGHSAGRHQWVHELRTTFPIRGYRYRNGRAEHRDSAGRGRSAAGRYYPSLIGHGLAQSLPENRVGWLASMDGASLQSKPAQPLFTDVEGRMCAVTVDLGRGRAVVATSELAEDRIRFAPGLGRDTQVWLRTDHTVIATHPGRGQPDGDHRTRRCRLGHRP